MGTIFSFSIFPHGTLQGIANDFVIEAKIGALPEVQLPKFL
jgi:hypothetical protein